VDGKAAWSVQGLRDLEVEQVLDMSQDRMSVRDVAAELGIGKSKVSRIQAKLKADGRL
jgi:DNA-directed RNA polymerase specialized sigma subunit